MFKRTVFVVIAVLLALPGSALAKDASADIDQCANGTFALHESCAGVNWVNGNLNGSKAHWFEGDSVSYRLKFSDLVPLQSYTVTIQWDTTKSDKHALDYLTSYDRTESTSPDASDDHANANDACSDFLSSCGTPSTIDIPADTRMQAQTDWAGSQIPGDFTMWGATLTGRSGYSYDDGLSSGQLTTDSSTSIDITFTATSSTAVLAWGGHIATRKDWGLANSAIAIPGSPYHMRLLNLNPPDRGGNQDRSLTADAVIYPAYVTIAKVVHGGGSGPFDFTAGGLGLTFAGDTAFQLQGGDSIESDRIITFGSQQTVTETQPTPSALWSTSAACDAVVPGLAGTTGTAAVNGTNGYETDFNLFEGDTVTCTYTNTFTPAAPSLSTSASDSVTIGYDEDGQPTTIHDTAFVGSHDGSGTDGYAVQGSVSFRLYDNDTCSGDPVYETATPVAIDNSSNANSVSVDSPDVNSTDLVPGTTYHWVAAYTSSDGNNVSVDFPAEDDAACGDASEDVTINKATPSISTQVTADGEATDVIGLGHSVVDVATLSGGYNVGASQTQVTFKVYKTDAAEPVCDDGGEGGGGTLVATLDAGTLSEAEDGTITATSGSFKPASTGHYEFVADWAGDASNNAATHANENPCGETGEGLDVVKPLIAVTKAPKEKHAYDGDFVHFTISISNPAVAGAEPIALDSFSDDIKGTTHGCETLSDFAGDGGQEGILDVGETWSATCGMTVKHDEENSAHDIVNVVSATGHGVDSGDPVSGSSQAAVKIVHPAIAIDKTGPATAQAGDKVGYVLTVTNPGDEGFAEATVTIADEQCNGDPVALIGKGGDASPDSLDPGDVWTYSCSRQTAVGDTSVHNVASVTGCDEFGKCVNASDDADTALSQPEQLVLPERITPGVARLLGPTGCQAKAFNARVRGTKIKTVVFVLDGKKVKTLRKPNRKGLFQLRVNPKRMRVGVHRLVANITFDPKSGTKPKSLRLSFQRCAKKFVAPRFTG